MAKHKSEQSSAHYNGSLLDIVREKSLYSGNLDKAFNKITEAAANTLSIERASIWLFTDDRKNIRCENLYERGPHRHSDGVELNAADYPAYFAAIEESRAIVAHDAHSDPRTCEFSKSYLTPLGITSMLDAPIHFDGRTIGVICHEHIGQACHWDVAKINYAASLADLTSHAIAAKDRRHVEEALKESEERLKTVIDSVPALINLKDQGGRYLVTNRAHSAFFGIRSEDILGRTPVEIFSELGREIRDLDQAAMDNGMPIGPLDRRVQDSEGHERDLLVTKVPLRDTTGTYSGIATVSIDITERNRIEKARFDSEDLINSIFENVPVGLLIKNPDHIVESANSTYLSWYGFDQDGIVGQRSDEIEEFQTDEDVTIMNAQEREVLTTGATQSRQVDRLFADGEIHTVNITKFPVYDQQGRITKIGSVSVDLTEQVQAQGIARVALMEAERANQAKSKFLATMSHDLRSPLNAIIGFADLISLQTFGPITEKYQEYAGNIKYSGELLLSLVNDILDLSAVEAGKRSISKENISLLEVAAECVNILKEKAQAHGVDLRLKVPKSLPNLYADRLAMMQVLINLLSNSIKFTLEGGKVVLRATATNEHQIIEVSDTGMGIPADKIASITNPFVTGEADPHKTEDSTGLGLAIVKSLVDLHEGELDIKSEVGKGTTVTVTLPNDTL